MWWVGVAVTPPPWYVTLTSPSPPLPHAAGPRQTFFAYQATRFADLYGTSCTNLLNYAPGFHFIAPHSLVRGAG